MNRLTGLRSFFFLTTIVSFLFAQSTQAQDAVKADPKHYKVVFENDTVRVLRITYGPREKSVMHEHPNSVFVLLTDESLRFTTPDGKTVEITGKTGDAGWGPAGKHLPENLMDKSFEAILIELKPKMSKAK